MTNTFMLGGNDDPGENPGAGQERHLRPRASGGRAGGHHLGQVRLQLHRGYRIENESWCAPDQGRTTLIGDGPTVLDQVAAIVQRHGARRRHRHLRQGRAVVPAGVGQPTLLIEGLTGRHRA
jgi:TldD protein